MKKYRVGLIGVGDIAKVHYDMLSAIPERCEVIGMVDPDAKMLEKRQKEWGYRTFDSLDAMLAEKPDATWVMTPVRPRMQIVQACFDADCHVFTEKPLALSIDDTMAFKAMVEKSKKTLSIGCNERHIPASFTMAKLFQDGVLGSLIKVYAQTFIHRTNEFWAKKFDQPDAWRLTFDACGGRIFEFSIHLVNWVQWIGGDPLYVSGVNDAVSEALAKGGLDDVVSALIKFRQGYGVVETIMAPGVRSGSPRKMGIVGTKGECWYDEAEKKVRLVVPGENRDEFLTPIKCPNRAEEFFDALDNNTTPINDVDAAIATTHICCAFNESVRTKQTVKLGD